MLLFSSHTQYSQCYWLFASVFAPCVKVNLLINCNWKFEDSKNQSQWNVSEKLCSVKFANYPVNVIYVPLLRKYFVRIFFGMHSNKCSIFSTTVCACVWHFPNDVLIIVGSFKTKWNQWKKEFLCVYEHNRAKPMVHIKAMKKQCTVHAISIRCNIGQLNISWNSPTMRNTKVWTAKSRQNTKMDENKIFAAMLRVLACQPMYSYIKD